MDVYLKRTYGHHSAPSNEHQATYPFWDYRSRRRRSAFPCPQENEGAVSSLTENADMTGHSYTTQTEVWDLNLDPCPVTLHIITESHHSFRLLDLYQQVVNWVDPTLKLVRITERDNICSRMLPEETHSNAKCSDHPAVAITLFLRGTDQDGEDRAVSSNRLEDVRQIFQHLPWRFHHSEKFNQGNMNALSNNSQDFYFTSHDLPLWAVRQVHYGREHIRYVLYTSDSSWPDQVHFYQLVLGLEPDLLRDDFCLFTVCTQESYDVQFALKKLDSNFRLLTLQNVHIQVKVVEAGHLVPLFPNVCRQISDLKWQTTDYDGNIVVLDVSPVTSHPHNSVTKNASYHTSRAVVYKDHHFTCKQFSESYCEVQPCLEGHQHLASLQIQDSDLSLKLMSSQHLSYSQQLEISASSDEADLDIELPSPPMRYTPKLDDDETSLTLTNTSEESGIHMQNGSEDLSFCEEEGLRSCLSKNFSLKVRHVKFKVRFKEEIEAFEDTSGWHSSGIESEDQSDQEMETRFPYVPSTVAKSTSFEECSAKTRRCIVADTGVLCSDPVPLMNSDTDIKNVHPDFPLVNRKVPQNMYRTQSCQSCLSCPIRESRDTNINNHPQSKMNTQEKVPSQTIFEYGSCRHKINHPSHQVSQPSHLVSHPSHLVSHPSYLVSQPSHCSSPNTSERISLYNESSSEENLGSSHPVFQSPVCHQCSISSNHTITNSQHSSCSKEMKSTSSFSYHPANKQQIPSRPSSEATPAKANQDRQHQNRTSSNVNILNKEHSLPATPPVRDNRTKLLLAGHNLFENKTLDNCTKSDSSSLHQFPNGQKKFWFADSNLDLARNGCSDVENTTLKFTLKFDTCPTSGLPSGQEQIGFYV